MKIAMVSPNVIPNNLVRGHVGGAETYVFSLSLELAKQNHSVTLITASKDGASEHRLNDNLEIKYLPMEKILSWDGEDPFSRRITTVLLNKSYDLVHIHQIFTGFNVAACIASKLKRIPSFGTDHGGGPIFYRIVPQVCVDLPDYLVTVSDYSLDFLKSIVPNKKSFVAYGGVDTQVFNPNYPVDDLRKNLGLEGYKVVLCVGRLISCKGYDVAIKALHHLPANIKLLIVGPVLVPSYYQYLKQLAQPFGDRVVFVGHASAQDLPRYYNLCDVFVRSSVNDDCFGHHYNFPELLGLVKFEAMACGKPVVVSDVGGLPEQVISGQHGYVVRAGDDRQLAMALKTILSDDSLCKKMGQQSLDFVRANFSWRRVAQRVAEFYKASC
jgi:glycosyltransferase involved in cell wall biosynthesis